MKPAIRLEDRVHGLVATYRAGCHCTECRAAKNAKNREWRQRRLAASRGAYQPIVTSIFSVAEAQNPMLRPDHYPPPCTSCNGFGYTPPSWSRCGACREFPGHAMSHADWSRFRA